MKPIGKVFGMTLFVLVGLALLAANGFLFCVFMFSDIIFESKSAYELSALNGLYDFKLPATLKLVYSAERSYEEHYYVFDVSKSNRSFLNAFAKKCESEPLDYFFDRVEMWKATEDLDGKYTISPTDEFVWSYSLRHEELAAGTDLKTVKYDYGAAVAVYNASEQYLYCYYEYKG